MLTHISAEINDSKELPKGSFSVNLKNIDQYQQKDYILMDKYEMSVYQKDYFHGWTNININLLSCEDKIVIPPIIQSYVLHWYRTYLLHLVMIRMEAMIN